MTTLIIPTYYASEELRQITKRCMDSIKEDIDQKILQEDPSGEGYCKTVNRALELADGDIIIVGNNDLVFPENWLTELLFPLNVGYDIATCWTSDQDYLIEDRIENGAKFGSLFAMHRKVYETIGGFDEMFKGYFGDTDYRRRALEAGFKVGRNRSLVVEHTAKATYDITDPKDKEFLVAQRYYEAKWGEPDVD